MKLSMMFVIGGALLTNSCTDSPTSEVLDDTSAFPVETKCYYGLLDDVTDPDADSHWAFLTRTDRNQAAATIDQYTLVQEIFADGEREDGYEEARAIISVDAAAAVGIVKDADGDAFEGTIQFNDGGVWEWKASELKLTFKERQHTMASLYKETATNVYVEQRLTKANGKLILATKGEIAPIDCGEEFAARKQEITGS